MPSSDAVLLATAATGLVLVLLALVASSRAKATDKEGGGREGNASPPPPALLPRAAAGTLETIRELAGDRAPYWMLEQVPAGAGCRSYRLPLGSMAVIGDPRLARAVLSDPDHEKALDLLRSFEITLGGTCMFTQPNDRARITRRNTSRAFGPELVRSRMNEACGRHVEEWIERVLEPAVASGAAIDPCREMLYVAFGVICEVVFDYAASREECNLFLKHGEVTAVEFGFKQMMNPLRPILGKWLAERARAFDSVRWIHGFGLRMLAEHQRKKRAGESHEKNTVIAIIDDDPRYASNEEKLPELLLWLFAGHDTVGLSMGTALYHLAKHKSEMDRVRTAILRKDKENAKANVGDDASSPPSSPSSSPYSSLKEVQNVIRESNRLLPATANISIRKLGKDVTTRDGRHRIPRGTTVFLPQFLPNRDPAIYDDPGRFRPTRWEDPTEEMVSAHMPFSVGPRSCPGLALARAEMERILPALVRDYDFDIVTDGEIKFFITLKPVGCLLRPKKRRNASSTQ